MLPNGSSKNSRWKGVIRGFIGKMFSSFQWECLGRKNKPTKIRISFPTLFHWKNETCFPIEKDKNSLFFPVIHEKHFPNSTERMSKMWFFVIFTMEKWLQNSQTLRFHTIFLKRNIFILVCWKTFIFQFQFSFSSLFFFHDLIHLYHDEFSWIDDGLSMHDTMNEMNSIILKFNEFGLVFLYEGGIIYVLQRTDNGWHTPELSQQVAEQISFMSSHLL